MRRLANELDSYWEEDVFVGETLDCCVLPATISPQVVENTGDVKMANRVCGLTFG